MPELWAMLLLGLACWVFRITFVLLPADHLPALLSRGLEYLAPAVLAGIAAVELTAVTTGGSTGAATGSLLAMAAVALVAYRTRNLTAAVGCGLAAILLMDLVLV